MIGVSSSVAETTESLSQSVPGNIYINKVVTGSYICTHQLCVLQGGMVFRQVRGRKGDFNVFAGLLIFMQMSFLEQAEYSIG